MKILQKNQIEQFLKSVSKYFEDNLYFSDSQNKHAIVTEIQSNLSIYIRSTNFYEDLLKYNLIEENENLEDLIDNIIYENNTEILEKIIEISFVHNLTVNKITSNNKIDCIANSNVNFLSPADGISFVNENEIIISYASTSYEMKKKDDKIISEILDAINLLNNDEKILYLSFMNKWKDYVLKVTKNLPFIDRLISISEEQRKILNSIKKILNDNINDKTREVLLKKFIKQTYNKKNISLEEMINLIDNQKLKNKSLKKEIKISISDNSFNSKEMFKIFLEVRDYIKNDTIKSLVLENIKTGSSVVFNKEKLELFNSIYKEKFDKISNVFITKDHLKFKESSFLKELINDLYINHFNINAQETLDMNLLEKNYKELNNFFKEKEEIKKIIIEKGKYENYQLLTKSYFSRLLVHLKTIKVYYDSKTIFEIDSFSENSNEIFLKELDGILKLSKDYNELDLVLVLKFLKEMYELNKDNKDKLTQHIISLTSTYVNAKLNKYYKTMTNNEKNNIIQYINELFENNEIIYFNKENSFFELNEEDLELEYSSNKDIIQDMETGESLSSLELDEEFFEKSSSLEKIGNLYFKEFIENNENLIEEEKTQLIENFIDKTFGGKEHIALEHALTDTIIKNNFSQGQTEIKKRMENFFFKKNVKKEKCFIIIVDYDNDGTLAKLSAEETKPYLQKKLGKYYENSDDVFVVYTQNANNTRGLTKFDFELVAKNFKTDKDIFIMTADNGTSNIEQINNILKTKKIVNNNGKTININVNNIIITDHHPMDATIENDIKKFYIENSDKVLLFNPVYVYSINNKSNEYEIIESNEKNVSGATTFIQSINFLFDKNNDKDTIKYLEWLSKISNVVDYVDTLHAEINDYSKINEVLLVAKRINILQKFTIYFYNILNSLDEKVFNSKKDYFYAIENLKEPLNKLALLFSRNLLENNIYFEELFNLNVKSKKDIINNLFIELQSLQSNYLKTIFKREDKKENNIDNNVLRLIKMFNDKSFDYLFIDIKKYILNSFDNKLNDKEYNIEEIVHESKNGKRFDLFLDNSIPQIPRKLILDVFRNKMNLNEGIYFFAEKRIIDNKPIYMGSARINGNYILPGFLLTNVKESLDIAIQGHRKAAGFKFSEKTLNKLRTNKYIPFYKKDEDTIIQKIVFSNIKDIVTTLNSINLTNNKKTGGLDFNYLINFNNIKNLGISIEKYFHIQLGKLAEKNIEKNIFYKEAIKSNKNYSIPMDYKTNLKVHINGTYLLEIINRIEKNENFYLNFSYFNNMFILKGLITESEFNEYKNENIFYFSKKYDTESLDVKEYKNIINDLRNKNNVINSNIVKKELITETNEEKEKGIQKNLLVYDINIEKLKNSKKRLLDEIPFFEDFKDILKSFGLYTETKNEMKNLKVHLEKLENYYDLLYQNTGSINYLITDTETNGLQSPLTQVGFVLLEGKIINNKWKLSNFKNFTTLIKYNEHFGVSPAIENLTKIDEELLLNYGTSFNELGKVLKNFLPEVSNTTLIAHNLPFDSGILSKHPDVEFSNYIKECKKFDTARISRELNTAGSYQLMTKLFITNDQLEQPIYLGMVPDNLNSINAKITNKLKTEGSIVELITIKGNKIIWKNDKITLKYINGATETYYGRLLSKDGHDIRLYSVEQNLYNMFLNSAKDLIKKDYKIDYDKILLNKINKYISEEIFSDWSTIERSGKISKNKVLEIIERNFILPNYKNSLLLTGKQKNEIFMKCYREINIYKNLTRILDRKELADKFFDIYLNLEKTEIEKIKSYKNELIPLLENSNLEKNVLNEEPLYINLIKIDENNIQEKDIFSIRSMILSYVKRNKSYKELEKLLLKTDTIKKMMVTIFDENHKLNLLYNNTRQEKAFFHMFVKNLNLIEEVLDSNSSKNKIKNYIKENEELNSIMFLSIKDKVELFSKFLILNDEPTFKLTVKELHNNFNASGDVSLESLVLPTFYLKRLEDFSKEKKDEIIKNISFNSNLTDLTSQIRNINFNTATNQLMYYLNINDNNLKILKDSIEINLKINNYTVIKKWNIEEIKKEFPIEQENIINIINDYNIANKKEQKELLNELYMLFSFNSNIDFSLDFQISKIDNKIQTLSFVKTIIEETELLIKAFEVKSKKLDNNEKLALFSMLKELYKNINNKDYEEKEIYELFDLKLLKNLAEENNTKIDDIFLSNENQLCTISFMDKDNDKNNNDKNKKSNKKITKKITFSTQFIIAFSRRIAKINTLLNKNNEEKEIDFINISSYENFKEKLENILKNYGIIYNELNNSLSDNKIFKENLKTKVSKLLEGIYYLNKNENSFSESKLNNKIKELSKYIVNFENNLKKSNVLSSFVYELSGINISNTENFEKFIFNNNLSENFRKKLNTEILSYKEFLEKNEIKIENNQSKISKVNKKPKEYITSTLKTTNKEDIDF